MQADARHDDLASPQPFDNADDQLGGGLRSNGEDEAIDGGAAGGREMPGGNEGGAAEWWWSWHGRGGRDDVGLDLGLDDVGHYDAGLRWGGWNEGIGRERRQVLNTILIPLLSLNLGFAKDGAGHRTDYEYSSNQDGEGAGNPEVDEIIGLRSRATVAIGRGEDCETEAEES